MPDRDTVVIQLSYDAPSFVRFIDNKITASDFSVMSNEFLAYIRKRGIEGRLRRMFREYLKDFQMHREAEKLTKDKGGSNDA